MLKDVGYKPCRQEPEYDNRHGPWRIEVVNRLLTISKVIKYTHRSVFQCQTYASRISAQTAGVEQILKRDLFELHSLEITYFRYGTHIFLLLVPSLTLDL